MLDQKQIYEILKPPPTQVIPFRINSDLFAMIQSGAYNLTLDIKDSKVFLRNGEQEWELRRDNENVVTQVFTDTGNGKFLCRGTVKEKYSMPAGTIGKKIKQMTIDSSKAKKETSAVMLDNLPVGKSDKIAKKSKTTVTTIRNQNIAEVESPMFVKKKVDLAHYLATQPRSVDDCMKLLGMNNKVVMDLLTRVFFSFI
jgi:hypothetical protein